MEENVPQQNQPVTEPIIHASSKSSKLVLISLAVLVLLSATAAGAYYLGAESTKKEMYPGPQPTQTPTFPTPITEVTTIQVTNQPTSPVPTQINDTPRADMYIYFQGRVGSVADEKQIIPIEGWSAGTLKTLLPGLVDSDFDGVQAQQGIYRYTNGQLSIETNGEAQHSAGSAITQEGFRTLLQSLFARFNIPVSLGNQGVNQIMDRIK